MGQSIRQRIGINRDINTPKQLISNVINTQVHTHTYTHTHTHKHTHKHTHTPARPYTQTHTHMYTHTNTQYPYITGISLNSGRATLQNVFDVVENMFKML